MRERKVNGKWDRSEKMSERRARKGESGSGRGARKGDQQWEESEKERVAVGAERERESGSGREGGRYGERRFTWMTLPLAWTARVMR